MHGASRLSYSLGLNWMDLTTWHVLDPLRALLDRGGSGGNAELVCDVDAALALPQTSCC